MYIQQTILCKHVKYVSFLKTWCHLINTGNIGIRKHHKRITFWAFLNAAHCHRNQRRRGLKNPLVTRFSVLSMAFLVTFVDPWCSSNSVGKDVLFHILGSGK